MRDRITTVMFVSLFAFFCVSATSPIKPHAEFVPGIDVTPQAAAGTKLTVELPVHTQDEQRACTAAEESACTKACSAISEMAYACTVSTDARTNKLTLTCRCHIPVERLTV